MAYKPKSYKSGIAVLKQWQEEKGVPFKSLGPYVEKARQGDKEATEVVYASSVRLILAMGNRFSNLRLFDDFVSQSFVELQSAIRRWDRSTQWQTYATFWIRRAASQIRRDSAIRVPRDQPFDVLPPIKSITDLVEERMVYKPHSIPLDLPQLDLSRYGLSDGERQVLTARYGLGGVPQSLVEVATMLNTTREMIRSIENSAMNKIRGGPESPTSNSGSMVSD